MFQLAGTTMIHNVPYTLLAGWSNCIILYICCSSLLQSQTHYVSQKQALILSFFSLDTSLRLDRVTSCPPESGLNASKTVFSQSVLLLLFIFLNSTSVTLPPITADIFMYINNLLPEGCYSIEMMMIMSYLGCCEVFSRV